MSVRLTLVEAFLLVVVCLIVGSLVDREFRGDHEGFRLAAPKPTTIAVLGLVPPPETHSCDNGIFGRCFDYLGGWCQAPCATYIVRATVVSVEPATSPPDYVVVLRDGDETIAGRVQYKPSVRRGDNVLVSGVLFFPTPRGRDGGTVPNGAELSPILAIV